MSNETIKSILTRYVLPWAVGLVSFWVVSNHYFAPQNEGKALGQHDVVQYAGMSQDIKEHRVATGEDPQWTGNMFGGMPAYLIDVEYPTQDVKQTVGDIPKAVGDPMNMIFFAMVMMMLAVVLMGINPWIGIVAGLAYGLSTYFFLIIDAGHITKMWALVYAPPMVASVWYTLRRNMWAGATLTALFGSLELGANHVQITYYFLIACFALWLSEMWYAHREHVWRSFGKRTLLLFVAGVLAVGSNFAPLWYTMAHKDSTARGTSEVLTEDEARQKKIRWNTAWSYGKAECLNMLVANYKGHSSAKAADGVDAYLDSPEMNDFITEWSLTDISYDLANSYHDLSAEQIYPEIKYAYDAKESYICNYVEQYNEQTKSILRSVASSYWGEQPGTGGPTYIGAVVIFLALMGLMLTSPRNRWWILIVSLFALLLAWGSNLMGFYELTFDYLPGYKNFRTVSMALVIIEWSAPLLAAIALWHLWRMEISFKALARRVAIACGIIAVGLMLMLNNTGDYGVATLNEYLGNEWWVEQLKEVVANGRRAAFMADMWRTVGYVTISAAVVLGYAWLRQSRYITNIKREWALIGSMTAICGVLIVMDMQGVNDRYMGEDKWTKRREAPIAQSAADREILKDKEIGYRVFDCDNTATARASFFHRSVDGYHGAKLGRYEDVLNRYIYQMDEDVLAMLNTKYIISNGSVIPLDSYGAAWFVATPTYASTPIEEFEALGTCDLRNSAIVAHSVSGLEERYSTAGNIALTEYAPNYLKYEYTAPTEVLAIFSEIYFPDGWSAYIDGVEAEYFCADYILRGMELPAGEHVVEWRFKAPNWGMATAITGIASWLILIALVLLVTAPLSRRYITPHIKVWYANTRTRTK